MLRAWMQDSVPPTSYYDERPGRWVAEREWPPGDRPPLCFRLAPYRLLDESEVIREQPLTVQSPLTVGLFAGKWCSYSATPDLPHDQRQEDGGALTFDSAPLAGDAEILGAPVLDLDFAASEPIAMVAVRLSDIAPDDKATRVTYGLLNLTHRDGHDEPKPLEPGKRYRVQVQLNDVAQRFPAGHRIRLAISTSYWPLAWTPPAHVRLSVLAGASTLSLPVREPCDDLDATISFPEPEGAPVPEITRLEPTHHTWRVIRDLATDESTLEVVKDEGVYRIDEIDLVLTDRVWEWYTSTADDFDSLRGEVYSIRGFRRGDWSIETHTRTVLTSTPEHFELHAELDAYEGERRVFSQNWDETVQRRLL
jgi:uncharacterized protein